MEAIKYYVKGAFQGVTETPQVLEQQEELIADLTAKVADLVTEGRSQDEALGMAIASMGDLSALVAEFETPGDGPAAIPTATVYSSSLDLHVVALSVGVGALLMLLCTVLGALTGAIQPGAGLVMLATLVAAAWWLRGAYLRFAADPDAVETRELAFKQRKLWSLMPWAGVSFGAMVLNIASGTDFWFWPIWVAATVYPISIIAEEFLSGRAEFAAPTEPTVSAPSGA
ncbi:MAG: permease prefix domain 1-containing protein [Actinomycetota bacterium]|nr:permease prefix domain 1-containing protein [Actinomycetota bacterium]